MTFIRTSFALNDIPNLGVQKGSGSVSFGVGRSHSDGSPLFAAAPHAGAAAPRAEAPRGGSAASQPGPGTCCLATRRQVMLTSRGGEQLHACRPARLPACPPTEGGNTFLNWRAGSRQAGAVLADGASRC